MGQPLAEARPYAPPSTNGRLLLFGGRSHPALVRSIAAQLEVEPGNVELETFANGETYCRYHESIRGADVFIVQTGSEPVDRNVMELLFMIQAARLASASRVTAVIPWFPYAKQDRKTKPREPISARLIADMLQLAGADRVLTMDLHAGQIQGFFSIPVDHMTCLPLFVNHFRKLNIGGPDVASVAPDAGRAKYAERLARHLGAGLALIHKTRPAHDRAVVKAMVGDVEGKIAVIPDDLTITGWTMAGATRTLLERGAREVWVAITHAVFADGALERIQDAGAVGILLTDTVPLDPASLTPRVTVLSTVPLLAETILNVCREESVSALFGGENQLF
jgi:ribose-phosphate pyrophosphokinase